MLAAASVGVALRAFFIVLWFMMVAGFLYLFAVDGFCSCYYPSARWEMAIVMNFSIYPAVVGAWFFYKESSWIKTAIFVVSMFVLGSLLSIGYILVQFFKLSREESTTKPLYFVLVRRHEREHTSGISVVAARAIFSALACLTLGALIYTVIKDISGSYADPMAKCFVTNMTDLSILAAMSSVWIGYKESSWRTASLWIISLLCFGSITLCVYVVQQLFCISPEQPASSIIFNSSDIYLQSSEALLTSQVDVNV